MGNFLSGLNKSIVYHNQGNNASLDCKCPEIKICVSHQGVITKAKYNTNGKAMQAMHSAKSKNS
jgi:hypothetical protein